MSGSLPPAVTNQRAAFVSRLLTWLSTISEFRIFFRKVTFQCIDIGKLCKIPATKTARIVYTHQPLGTYGS